MQQEDPVQPEIKNLKKIKIKTLLTPTKKKKIKHKFWQTHKKKIKKKIKIYPVGVSVALLSI